MTNNMTENLKQERIDWLIDLNSESLPNTDSAMNELIDLANEFVDTHPSEYHDKINDTMEFNEFLKNRMSDNNKPYYMLPDYKEPSVEERMQQRYEELKNKGLIYTSDND